MTEEILLTQEGYDKIIEEHKFLVSTERAAVAERVWLTVQILAVISGNTR